MRTRSALLAAAALGALCLCALWSLRARRGVDALAPPAIPVPADAVAPAPPVVGPAQGEVPARRDAAEPIAPALSAAAPARERGALEVEVVAADGSPAALARVRALADAEPRPALFGPTADSASEREDATDEHGRVRFDDLPVGRFEVQAARTAGDGRAASARGWVVVDGARAQLRLTLAERAALVVRVRDAAREPVAGAEVELVGGAAHPGEQAAAAQLVRATTGADGRARFEDRDYAGLVAVARAPDGRAGTASLWTRGLVERALASGGIDVVVGAPARLAGRLTGVDAARLASARVAARLLDNATPYYTTHGRAFETAVADGGYAFESLAPGTYTLSLIDPAGARLVLPELKFGDAPMANSLDPIEVELAPGAKVVRDLAVTQGAVLEGLVRDARGAPVADATVLTTFAPSTSNFPDGFVVRGANVWRYDAQSGGDDEHPESHRRARTDAAGAYRIAGLPAGALRVEVAAHGLTYDRREAVPMRDGETVRLEHVLREAGAIAGVFRRSGYLGVQRVDESAPRMVAILPRDGSFCFPGLEAGDWRVGACHSDASVEPVWLAEVHVDAGRTTWIDVDRAGTAPIRIAGRVLDASGPVAGARVRVYPEWITTGPDGAFEARSAFPHTAFLRFNVERDGVTTRFEFPPMQANDREWRGELVLGSEALFVRALDADGAPSAALVDVMQELEDAAPLAGIEASGLAIPATGERAIGGLAAGRVYVSARFGDGAVANAVADLPAREPLVLRAPATGVLTVAARFPDGSPAPGRDVSVSTWLGSGAAPADGAGEPGQWDWKSATTGSDGDAVIAGVVAGEVWVRIELDRFARRDPAASPQDAIRTSLARGERARLVVAVADR